MTLDLTPGEIAHIQAALFATCATGGSSVTWRLIAKLTTLTGITFDIEQVTAAADRCLDEAVDAGVIARVLA